MEYSAIVHFADKRFAYALENGNFLFRLEAKKGDLKRVVMHFMDKYVPLKYEDTRDSVEMYLLGSDRYKDYFEVELSFDMICMRYCFELEDREGMVQFFGNHMFFDQKPTELDCMFDCPKNLRVEEIFSTPDWAKNKVVYQIFPSSFASSHNPSPEEWYQKPMDYKTRLHGDLKGIKDHLPYLKDLGIDVIYMTPVFKAPSNHKYDTEDYYQLDPDFGTNEDLKELVNAAHALNMRVILDGVFNHTSTRFFAFLDILKNQENSEYKDFYYINHFPLETAKEFHQRNEKRYQTFSYFSGMPKLNLSSKRVQDYILDVAKYWVKECHIDGWRLDVGDEISHSFWKRFRKEMKDFSPDLLIVGEIWHFAGDFLEGDEWDSVMNYQFYQSVQSLVASGTMKVSEFVERQMFMAGHVNSAALPLLWNLMGSHDTARFYHNCGKEERKLMLGASLMLLNPGMPMIYYGDEVGMDGGADPDCRRGMLWDEKRQNATVLKHYKACIKVRHELPAITQGRVVWRFVDDEAGILMERRRYQEEEVVLIFHCKDGETKVLESEGKKNLLNNRTGNGILSGYETFVYCP